jgi:hypothetical protein
MKLTDFKKGDILFLDYKGDGTDLYILMKKDDSKGSSHYCRPLHKMYSPTSVFDSSCNKYVMAIDLQKRHLLACIEANKYVDSPTSSVNHSYKIY